MKTILVAGGAGYIGSHMVAMLVKRGYEVVVADNLRTGHWQAVKGARKLYVGDLRDAAFLDRLFTENKIDGVINFAAFSLVGESVTDPLKYYGNNVEGAVSLLNAMKTHGGRWARCGRTPRWAASPALRRWRPRMRTRSYPRHAPSSPRAATPRPPHYFRSISADQQRSRPPGSRPRN